MNIVNTIKTYFILTKPRLWTLLVYSGLAGYFIGLKNSMNQEILLLLLLALLSGTAGANTITSYIDRDIDAIMERTRNRPLPRGLIYPPIKALYFGAILSIISILLTIPLGIYPTIFMVFGLIDNIIIYSYLSKRKTSWNIILGSFSGGAPIIIGYTTATHTLDIIPILWAALIVIWTPVHIWSLALFYKEDYRKAGVPMLPTVTSEKTAIRCIASSSVLLILFSILLPIISHTYLNYIYISVVSIADVIIMYFALKLIIKPTEKDAWKLFKATSPYLAILLTIGIVSHTI